MFTTKPLLQSWSSIFLFFIKIPKKGEQQGAQYRHAQPPHPRNNSLLDTKSPWVDKCAQQLQPASSSLHGSNQLPLCLNSLSNSGAHYGTNMDLARSQREERASQVALMVKNPPANAGNARDSGSIPGWGRSPGGENGNPLQYSCLKNPTDREAQWATVQGFAKSWTWLSD